MRLLSIASIEVHRGEAAVERAQHTGSGGEAPSANIDLSDAFDLSIR